MCVCCIASFSWYPKSVCCYGITWHGNVFGEGLGGTPKCKNVMPCIPLLSKTLYN